MLVVVVLIFFLFPSWPLLFFPFSLCFPPTSFHQPAYPSNVLLAFSFTIYHFLPSPSSSFPVVASLFSPFLSPQQLLFSALPKPRQDHVGVRTQHPACTALFPSPATSCIPGVRSRLIGCLSCWGWWGQEMPTSLCPDHSFLTSLCESTMSSGSRKEEDKTLGDLKHRNPRDKTLVAASERMLHFIWPASLSVLPSISGRLQGLSQM